MRWDEMHGEIRRLVETRLVNRSPVYAPTKDPKVARSTTGVTLEYWIQGGQTESLELGDDVDRTEGFVQVDVYRPLQSGLAETELAIEEIRGALKGERINLPSGGVVRFDRQPPSFRNLGGDGRHWRTAVTVPFTADDV